MHRLALVCRGGAAASQEVIARAHALGVRRFETPFVPQLARAFPDQSTVVLKTSAREAGELEFQARSFRAQLAPNTRLVLMMLDPEFQVTAATEPPGNTVEDSMRNFFTVSQRLCDAGVVESYGVSSNALASSPSSGSMSVSLIQSALRMMPSSSFTHFKHLQFPRNLLERALHVEKELADSVLPADWEICTNRPLTAFVKSSEEEQDGQEEEEEQTFRLAEADFPLEYAASLEALLQHLTPPAGGDAPQELVEACQWLRNLFSQLDEQLSRFSSILHWERELQQVVLPLINDKFDELDEDTVRLMTDFFKYFALAVRESGGAKSRERVMKMGGSGGGEAAPLQELAFKFALKHCPRGGKVAIHASTPQQVEDWARWVKEEEEE